jgi:peptidoglycan/LPS O-acetylase OafA/YrhL
MKSQNITYITGVDHIRAYASLLIVSYHGIWIIAVHYLGQHHFVFWNPLAALIVEGHTAVGIFITLSGFILMAGNRGSKIIYKKFLLNRILRIYPLFIFLIIVGISAYPENFSFIGLLQTLLLPGIFPGALEISPFNGMFWMISILLFLYAIFPFLKEFIETNTIFLNCALVLLIIAFRILAIMNGANPRDVSYWTIVSRLDQFVIGMIAGKLFDEDFITAPLKKILLFALSAIVCFAVVFAYHINWGWSSAPVCKVIWPTVEACIWIFFIIAYIGISTYVPKFLSNMLIFIGKISYSIFLVHFIIMKTMVAENLFVEIPILNSKYNAILNIIMVAIPITLLLSYFTYRIIEEPFIKKRHRYNAI